MEKGQLVRIKSNNVNTTDGLTFWRILEINTGLSGRKIYFCEAAHDTKGRGFDRITRDFYEKEIELF